MTQPSICEKKGDVNQGPDTSMFIYRVNPRRQRVCSEACDAAINLRKEEGGGGEGRLIVPPIGSSIYIYIYIYIYTGLGLGFRVRVRVNPDIYI